MVVLNQIPWNEGKPYIIAEIGLNHNGSISDAKKLCYLAKEAGFNAVKFQLRSKNLFLDIYGSRDIGSEIVDDYIRKTFIDFDGYKLIWDYCESIKITCFFSVWDLEALEFAEVLNPILYKVASADMNNPILIEKIIETKKPIIFSTGMANENEIDNLINYLSGKNIIYALLHCHSAYPAPMHHLNLNYINNLKNKNIIDVGYSSHDLGDLACISAVAIGSKIIEKHITLSRKSYGNDHAVSLEPREFKDFVRKLRDTFVILGEKNYQRVIGPGEKANRISLSKTLILKNDLAKGDKVSYSNIDFYPSGEGLTPSQFKDFSHKKLIKNIKSGNILSKDFFIKEENFKVFKKLESHLFGIPVRYRDINLLGNLIKTNYLEIHMSMNDIKNNQFTELKNIVKTKKIGFHAPDIYEGNLVFDPISKNQENAFNSNKWFQKLCDHIKVFYEEMKLSYKVNCVTSFSSYSENYHDDSRKNEYKLINDFINKFEKRYSFINILPQTLPALAWYLGGQRFVNTFAHPKEIFNFCKQYNKPICLDISHLFMACNFYNEDFHKWSFKILPYAKHLHLAGANGIDDEGLGLEESPKMIEFLKFILKNNNKKRSFIVETWQGHLNSGDGFVNDLHYLEQLS